MRISPTAAARRPVASCRALSVGYGRRLVLDRIDLDLQPGITCLIGRNGAGKTTLFRALCGILRPTSGLLRVFGADPAVVRGARQAVGYLTHRPSLYRDLIVEDNLKYWARVIGLDWVESRAHVDVLVQRFGLEKLMGRRAGELSRGQQQRVAIARLLLARPALILLDEPGTGLDALGLRDLQALVSELARGGASVLYATHSIDEAVRLGDRFLLLAGGKAMQLERDAAALATEPKALADRLLEGLSCLGEPA